MLPEAEARKLAKARVYLDDESYKHLEDAVRSFYGPDPCYGLLDTTLRLFLPKGCEAAKDLAEKRYRVLERDFDQGIKERTELMESTKDPKWKTYYMDIIQIFKDSKEWYRKKAQEYGAEIPG